MSGGERTASPHESAALHVTGEARYVDDIPVPRGSLFVSVKGSGITAGELVSMDLTQVSESPGVVSVLTAESLPGSNDVSPVMREMCFCGARNQFSRSAFVRGRCHESSRGRRRTLQISDSLQRDFSGFRLCDGGETGQLLRPNRSLDPVTLNVRWLSADPRPSAVTYQGAGAFLPRGSSCACQTKRRRWCRGMDF